MTNQLTFLAKLAADIEDVVKLVEHQNLVLRQKLENNSMLEFYFHNLIILNSIAVENTMKILEALNEVLLEAVAKNHSAHT